MNIFEKQQNDRLAQLEALRIKSASNSSIKKKPLSLASRAN